MVNNLENPIHFFAVSAIILGLILSIFYLRHNFKVGLPQKLLTFVFIGMLYFFTVQFLIIFNLIDSFPHLFRTGAISSLIFIPLMYVFVSFELGRKKFILTDILHLIPAILYIVNFFKFFAKSYQEKQQIIYQIQQNNAFYLFNEGFLFSEKFVHAMRVLQLLVYIILLLLLLQKNWTILKHRFLLKKVTLLFIVYLSINFLIAFYWVLVKENSNAVLIALMINTLLFFLFFFIHPALLFQSLQQSVNNTKETNAIANNIDNEFVSKLNLPLNNKIEKKSKTGSRKRVRIGKIESYLNNNKPYLDQDFSLSAASNFLGISTKLLSQSIKLKYGLNFNSYINGLRIEYVLQKIHSDKNWCNLSVKQMATEVGFASTNLFYKYFNEKTGNTPRDYIQKLEDEAFYNET